MSLHLLDTDAVIDLLKNVTDTVSLIQGLHSQGDTLCTCDIVLGEVFSGLHPSDRARATPLLDGLLYLITTVEAARQAGEWRYDHARRGQQLTITDCLVAATAVDHAAVLVTGNTKDFPVPEVTLLPLPRPGRRSSR
jgi:predicted nucleic acid-binding protein